MDLVSWFLIVVSLIVGVLLLQELKAVREELVCIRKLIQIPSDYPHIAGPQQILMAVQKLHEHQINAARDRDLE
jgi:hypothetical protein